MRCYMRNTYQQLISAKELNLLLEANNTSIVILDASIPPVGVENPPAPAWPNSVIANARRFDLKKTFSDLSSKLSHTMPSTEQFENAARGLGINDDSQIIIYDDIGIYSAARAWWMFKAMGHNNVAVLNGGLPAWVDEDYQTVAAEEHATLTGNFTAAYHADYFCDSKQVIGFLDDANTTILDARAAKRFAGNVAEPRSGVRSGHIPNSFSLPFPHLLENGKYLDVNALKEAFAQFAGKHDKLIMSCGSGITACVLALGASICGYEHICVYDGSWADWGSGKSNNSPESDPRLCQISTH